MLRKTLTITSMVISLSGGGYLAASEPATPSSLTQDTVFDSTRVWDVHLRFTTEQWEAMEPEQESGSRFGGRRGSFLLGPEGGRNGIASALGWKFPEVHADLEFGDHQFNDVAVRYKGNGTFLSSQDSLKRSFKIDLNDFVKGQKLAGMSQINLHNSVRDPSHMNEAIGYQLFRDAGVPAPRTSFAKVYVTVPGTHDRRYFGLYNLVEDVGGAFVEEHFEATDGALLKPVTPSLFSDLGNDWADYNQTYDPKSDLSDAQKLRIIETCKFFSTSTGVEFAAGVGDYIDLDSIARYLATTVWLCDLDGILGPGQNYYIYLHPTTQRFMFIPWDQDQSFGQYPRGSQEEREQLSIDQPWNGGNPFLEKMFAVEAFKSRYLAALSELNESVIKPDQIDRQVETLADVLRGPVGEESTEHLAQLNKAAAGEVVSVLMTGGRSWLIEAKPIKAFVPARRASIAQQLTARSQSN